MALRLQGSEPIRAGAKPHFPKDDEGEPGDHSGRTRMTPAEFEWRQEQLEIAYEAGRTSSTEFWRGMKALGFGRETCDQILEEMNARRAVALTNGER